MSARDWITERAKALANERIARDILIGRSPDEVAAQASVDAVVDYFDEIDRKIDSIRTRLDCLEHPPEDAS